MPRRMRMNKARQPHRLPLFMQKIVENLPMAPQKAQFIVEMPNILLYYYC